MSTTDRPWETEPGASSLRLCLPDLRRLSDNGASLRHGYSTYDADSAFLECQFVRKPFLMSRACAQQKMPWRNGRERLSPMLWKDLSPSLSFSCFSSTPKEHEESWVNTSPASEEVFQTYKGFIYKLGCRRQFSCCDADRTSPVSKMLKTSSRQTSVKSLHQATAHCFSWQLFRKITGQTPWVSQCEFQHLRKEGSEWPLKTSSLQSKILFLTQK